MVFLRSLVFNIYFIGLTLSLSLILLPFLCLPSRWLPWIPSLWITLIFWGLKHFCGLSFRVTGRLPQHPCLIASNHQSTFETLVFHKILKNPVFIVKRELLFIPFLGWYLWKMGMIPVNRRQKISSVRTLALRVTAKLHQGRSVIIFPEGKRVLPGTKEPFKSGIASFYTRLNIPITPVATNSGLFWSRRSFIKKPGIITIEFLDPIDPGLPAKTFLTQLEKTIQDHLSTMTP